MPYPNIFASLAGDQPASKLDENFNAAQLLTGKNAASGYVGLDASSNASIAGALQVTGNINLGGQVISTGPVTASPVFIATGTAASVRGYTMRTGTANRWILETDSTAESGANAGSDFEIGRFDDTGAYIDSPWVINRASGISLFNHLPLGPSTGQLGYRRYDPFNGQSGSYNLAATDVGGMLFFNAPSGSFCTIPQNVFTTGDRIRVVNWFSGFTLLIVQGPGTTVVNAGAAGATGNRTLAANGTFADISCVGSNTFLINGVGLT